MPYYCSVNCADAENSHYVEVGGSIKNTLQHLCWPDRRKTHEQNTVAHHRDARNERGCSRLKALLKILENTQNNSVTVALREISIIFTWKVLIKFRL